MIYRILLCIWEDALLYAVCFSGGLLKVSNAEHFLLGETCIWATPSTLHCGTFSFRHVGGRTAQLLAYGESITCMGATPVGRDISALSGRQNSQTVLPHWNQTKWNPCDRPPLLTAHIVLDSKILLILFLFHCFKSVK